MQGKSKFVWMMGTLLLGVIFAAIIILVFSMISSKSVKLQKLTILSDSSEQGYTGKPLTDSGYTVLSGQLKSGHKLQVNCMGTQTRIGESENYFVAKVVDKNGTDVTEEYEIEKKMGKLTVTKIKITVITPGNTKTYDGTPLYSLNEFRVEPNSLKKEYNIEPTFPEDIFVTEPYESKKDLVSVKIYNSMGQDVTSYFDIEYEYGIIKVLYEE